MMKSNSGITLVALVITIIVLLILAGVSISLVVGDNGIMTRAKDAGTKTESADAVETLKLAVASLTSEYYEDAYTGTGVGDKKVATYIKEKLSDELATMDYSIVNGESNGFDDTLPTTDTPTAKSIKIKKTGGKEIEVSYTVTKDGNVKDIKEKTN